ncbi:MAG TPA: hypothetical protein VGI30_05240 [Caulobacteraceae bacterium]|jgi:hypothetical protein
MPFDSPVLAAFIGAAVMLFLGSIPFFIGWGSIHATHEALKLRITSLEEQMAQIQAIRADVAYIRGRLEPRLRVESA